MKELDPILFSKIGTIFIVKDSLFEIPFLMTSTSNVTKITSFFWIFGVKAVRTDMVPKINGGAFRHR